ncbi:MAG: GTPase HflX [Geminicoccaceae bacterium]
MSPVPKPHQKKEAQATPKQSFGETKKRTSRALVLHPSLRSAKSTTSRTADGRLAEAMRLAKAVDLEIVDGVMVPLRRMRPSTLIGPGHVDKLAARVKEDRIDLLIMDTSLSPIQQRNLEKALTCKVIDRTGLILEIFGARAQTKEGRLQVELAALSYQRSRLVRSWTHLERQRGGLGFVGGPGESQIELDRRRIDERITRIKGQLEAVKRTRGLHRQARRRVPYPVIALVGYTNAGKSTLFNRSTGAWVKAKDQLFATLDPTMRQLTLPSNRPVILSDTVGFVADLPTDLVAAFRATLEEVRTADLIIHVRDVSHEETDAQREDVLSVLADLELSHHIDDGSLIEFWNKTDLLSANEIECLRSSGDRKDGVVLGSAITGDGLDDLLLTIDKRLAKTAETVDLVIETSDGAGLAWLYRHGRVLDRVERDGKTHIRATFDPAERALLERRYPPESIVG